MCDEEWERELRRRARLLGVRGHEDREALPEDEEPDLVPVRLPSPLVESAKRRATTALLR